MANKRKKEKKFKKTGMEWLKKLSKFAGAIIPGIDITPKVYYHRKKLEFKAEAKATNQTVEQCMDNDLRNRISNINKLTNYQLASLALDLNSYFKADRYFRQGWLVDEYWKVYNLCDDEAQIGLNTASRW